MGDHSQHGVLVVEDDAAIRRLVSMILLRSGYRVELAADGLEAVLKLGLSKFDVIILDLMMPNLDGFTFLNTFARNEPDQLRKVIVTSAASPAVMHGRLEVEPFAILPKPFDINELVRIVRACIDAQQSS